jgi:hypothetical protein
MKRLGDAPNERGYSIWENKDKELVQKIKAIMPKYDIKVGDSVNHWRSGECRVVSFINDKELLVFSDKHQWHEVYQLKDMSADLSDSHLQEINDTYKVEDYFTDNFGTMFDGDKIVHSIVARIDNQYRKESYNEVSVAGLFHERFDLSNYDGPKFESSTGRGAVSCYFNADGNYVVRDHNLDLSSFKPCNPDEVRQSKIDEFLQFVSTHIGGSQIKYDESKGIWFTDRFAYKLFVNSENYEFGSSIVLELDAMPNQGASYYHNGNSRDGYKPIKKAADSSREEVLNKIRGILESHYSKEMVSDKLFNS